MKGKGMYQQRGAKVSELRKCYTSVTPLLHHWCNRIFASLSRGSDIVNSMSVTLLHFFYNVFAMHIRNSNIIRINHDDPYIALVCMKKRCNSVTPSLGGAQ